MSNKKEFGVQDQLFHVNIPHLPHYYALYNKIKGIENNEHDVGKIV